MATPTTQGTPTPTSSPLSLAPAPPSIASSSSVPGTPLVSPRGLPNSALVTRKEWVLPPRPKPGRKPATDTPPTKRKAQNRAAQRAFRERRASKVGELEEHIRQIEEEDEREQAQLREHILSLETEVEHFRAEVEAWANRAHDLEHEVNMHKAEKEELRIKSNNLARSDRDQLEAVPISPRRPQREEKPIEPLGISEPGAATTWRLGQGESMSCGDCKIDSRCECIEQAFKMSGIAYSPELSAPITKRPHSPSEMATNKRHLAGRTKLDAEELETDFTAIYSSKKTEDRFQVDELSETASPTMARDPCGFCQDGSPCLCAELENQASSHDEPNRLVPIMSHITPPPSDGDVQCVPELIYPNSTRPVTSINPCVNGPGTCAQCQSDPQSTLFCKSVAAMKDSTSNPTSNPRDACCDLPGVSDECCSSQALAQNDKEKPLKKPLLSCADAYTALSRHPRYSEASEQLGTWLAKLKTTAPRSGADGRPPMEIEAASVMGVLKSFDIRFGKG